LLYPPLLSTIATFSPKRWAGTFMGIFSISLALSSYFSGQLAHVIINKWMVNDVINASVFYLSYGRIAVGLLVVIVVVSLVFTRVQRWYQKQVKLLQLESFTN
jgi:dipeptide/tripeptide permease